MTGASLHCLTLNSSMFMKSMLPRLTGLQSKCTINWMEALRHCIGMLCACCSHERKNRYRDEWHVASSSIPDASGMMGGNETFAEIFWDIWNKLNYKFPRDRRCCYMFEMMTPRYAVMK